MVVVDALWLLLRRLVATVLGLLLDATAQLQRLRRHNGVRGLAAVMDELGHFVPRWRRKRGVVPTSPHFAELLHILIVRAPEGSGLRRLLRRAVEVDLHLMVVMVVLEELVRRFGG